MYKKRSEYRKMIRKNYFFDQLKPKLREIFDHVDRTGTSTISMIEIREALQLLNIDQATQKLENFEELLINSKDAFAKSDITFEDFSNICFHLLDFMDIQQNLKDCPVIDFLDPTLFVVASDNKIMSKNLSSKVLDESIILRKRIEMGYSLNKNIQQNIKILKNYETECTKNYTSSPYLDSFLKYSYSLRDCWAWISKCVEYRKTTTDFTQGLQKVLEKGYKNTNNLNNLAAPAEKILMTQYIIYLSYERQEALQHLGWSYADYFPQSNQPQLNEIIKSIEAEGDYSRAAAICVFHFSFDRAFRCVSNVQSTNNEFSFLKSILQLLRDWQANLNTETHAVMVCDAKRIHDECDEDNPSQDYSFEIFQHKTKPQKFDMLKKDLNFIKTLCQHLNPSDPYFRAICKFISNSVPLSEIIKDHDLNFTDRLAFAYRFLGAKTLENYLKEVIDEAKEKGYLGVLLLVGKNTEGVEIIQNYLNNTGDIQSVALLGVYFRLFRFPNEDYFKNLLSEYKDIMNKLGYWEDRILLEKKMMEIEKSFADTIKDRKEKEQMQDKSSYSASQRCYFCNSSLAHPTLLNQLSENRKSFAQMHKYEKTRINFCPDCLKPLPNCSICLLPVSVLNPYIELQEKIKRVTSKRENTTIDPEEALIWCQQCKHGGHFGHISEWFQNHTKCPVSGCMCECVQNDYQ